MPMKVIILRSGVLETVRVIARDAEVAALTTKLFTPLNLRSLRLQLRAREAATGDTFDAIPIPLRCPYNFGTDYSAQMVRWAGNPEFPNGRIRRLRLTAPDWPDTGDGPGRVDVIHPDRDTDS